MAGAKNAAAKHAKIFGVKQNPKPERRGAKKMRSLHFGILSVVCFVAAIVAMVVLTMVGSPVWLVELVGATIGIGIPVGAFVAHTWFGDWVYLSFKLGVLIPWKATSGNTIEWAWCQKVVDGKLKGLAYSFLFACETEEEVKSEYSPDRIEDPKDMLKAYRRAIKKAHGDVAKQKRRFWSFHNAAKRFGFTTREKAKDYLPDDSSVKKVPEL